MPFAATRMDPEVTILSPVSQTEKYHVIIAYSESKKVRIKMSLFTKQKDSNL